MGSRRERFQFCVLAVSLIGLVCFAAAPAAAQLCSTGLCVTAWQQDTPSLCTGCAYRTGANLTETVINNSSIQSNFGQLCSASLDGQVYAQPLVVNNVTIGTTTYKYVAYVVTQKDTLYAIDGEFADGTGCKILNGGGNGTSLLDGQYPVDCHYVGAGGGSACTQTLGPTIGILGTPVININSAGTAGTIYLVTETQNVQSGQPKAWFHWLHAVDIQSFSDSKVQICANGSCGVDSSTFSKTHIQRPGLLFANCGSSACGNANYVYIAFSMMDGNSRPYPNGAVFGYNVSNLGGSYFYFQTTLGQQQGSNGGGIWMGGAAPAFGPADATGKNWIYVTTANGTWDGSTNWGDSFLKLDPYQLTVSATTSGFFTPADEWARQSPTCPANQAGDMDYGSGGPMLLPDNELTNWAHLAVNGDKEGGLWFVNRTTPGGINSCAQNSCYLPLCVHAPPTNVETYFTGTRTIHTSPAYWDSDSTDPALSYMYVAAIGVVWGGRSYGSDRLHKLPRGSDRVHQRQRPRLFFVRNYTCGFC
jgi:hypothetical protein